eukprot:GHVL01007509.1.p1 GENE.GHVL01007509.1~~GHVL01007509.1.p1  ORF type:complete len:229 (+),score=62.13 GHVL01007509.1:60-746(+)
MQLTQLCIFLNFSYIIHCFNHYNFLRQPIKLLSRRCSGFRSTREGKADTIETVTRKLKKTDILLAIRGGYWQPADRREFERNIPPGVFLCMVKNSLMRIVCEENEDFCKIINICKGQNIYIFLNEEELIPFLDAFEEEREKNIRFKKMNKLLGGVSKSVFLTPKDVRNLRHLPSKETSIAKTVNSIKTVSSSLARCINVVPTKLASSVSAVSTTLARVISLAKTPKVD